MSLFDIILLAVALAMDCFTVSIVSGVIAAKSEGVKSEKGWIIRMAFLFGFFQALMPLIGWLGICRFQTYMEAYDHWIAFALNCCSPLPPASTHWPSAYPLPAQATKGCPSLRSHWSSSE